MPTLAEIAKKEKADFVSFVGIAPGARMEMRYTHRAGTGIFADTEAKGEVFIGKITGKIEIGKDKKGKTIMADKVEWVAKEVK